MCITKYSNGFVELNVTFCALEISLILVRIKNGKRETKKQLCKKHFFRKIFRSPPPPKKGQNFKFYGVFSMCIQYLNLLSTSNSIWFPISYFWYKVIFVLLSWILNWYTRLYFSTIQYHIDYSEIDDNM